MELHRFKEEILPAREKLLGYATGMLNDPCEAEDVVQELLLRLWYMRDRLTTHPNVAGLAVRMAKNLCIDRLRARKHSRARPEEYNTASNGNDPYRQVELRDSIDKVLDIMACLPTLQKLIFRMKLIDGYEIGEIAEITDTSPEAVRMNLSRARKKIKEMYLKTETK